MRTCWCVLLRIPAWEHANAERAAEFRRERAGQPLSAQSRMLPPNLPAPFDNWPRGRQRSFSVTPDDTITLRTLGVFEETDGQTRFLPRRFS